MTVKPESRIVKAFEKEVNLTEEGLALLVENKKTLVIEFNTKSGMTLARKERTERNKLIEQVKRVSIDTENAIKAKRATIIESITSAYNCIVEPFEKEELRLKQEKEAAAEKEAARVKTIKDSLNGIRNFSLNLFGKSSQELSDIIEAVDTIDVEDNFSEFTQEAIQIKKEVLTELNINLSGAIQREELEAGQAKLKQQQEELAKQQAEFNAQQTAASKPAIKLTDKMATPDFVEETPSKESDDGFGRLTSKELMIADVVEWGAEWDITNAALDNLSVIIDKYMQ